MVEAAGVGVKRAPAQLIMISPGCTKHRRASKPHRAAGHVLPNMGCAAVGVCWPGDRYVELWQATDGGIGAGEGGNRGEGRRGAR